MAYGAPELLLVGAAQNLVLGGSINNYESGPCAFADTDDDMKVLYDLPGFW